MQWVYLEAASFRGIQDKELFEQVLAVCRHVERNPVFTTQHTLSQFLVMDKDMESQQQALKIHLQTFTLYCLTSKVQQPTINVWNAPKTIQMSSIIYLK